MLDFADPDLNELDLSHFGLYQFWATHKAELVVEFKLHLVELDSD